MKTKFIPIFFLFFMILLSGCTNQKIVKQEFSIQLQKSIDDLFYKVEVYPLKVPSDDELKLRVYLESKKTLKDFHLNFYDTCVFIGKNTERKFDLEKDSPKIIPFSFKAGKVDLPTSCDLWFKMSYTADFEAVQDIIVMSDAEYEQRSRSNTLNEISAKFEEEKSPLHIILSFTEQQPFKEGREIGMKIEYENLGSGDLEIKDLTIEVPNNLKPENCDDFEIDGQKLKLKDKKVFYGKRASSSLCLFKTKTNVPINIQKMKIYGTYKYELKDYINVEVTPK